MYREKLKKTEDLHNEVGKLEHLNKNKINNNNIVKNGKTPCKLCSDNGKGTRFHPEAKCWFKDQENKQGPSNKFRQVNNLALDVEISQNDPKN